MTDVPLYGLGTLQAKAIKAYKAYVAASQPWNTKPNLYLNKRKSGRSFVARLCVNELLAEMEYGSRLDALKAIAVTYPTLASKVEAMLKEKS